MAGIANTGELRIVFVKFAILATGTNTTRWRLKTAWMARPGRDTSVRDAKMDCMAPTVSHRPSTGDDLPRITEIYAHYVQNTISTFEIDPPDHAEMARRRLDILGRKLPYLVAESNGIVVGYAYASPYRPRPAYRFTVEDSIYVHPDHVRKGIGRLLLSAVIASCESQGFRQMVAVIGNSANASSIGLHETFGFRHAGLLRSVGLKFGGWIDTVLMQRPLGDGDSTLPTEIL